MSDTTTRRQFLRAAGGLGAGALLGAAPVAFGNTADKEPKPSTQRKLIVVLFGGGTRSSESIDDTEHRWIPHLWNEMVPMGTLFTNIRIEGKVVHPNSAGSIATGHWEWDDIDWSRPVAHPTIYEINRKARTAPDTAAWAFVYASILANTGQSRAPGYGRKYAANVVEPPTIARTADEQMDRLMRQSAAAGSTEAQLKAAEQCADLARSQSRISLTGLRSPQARAFVEREYAAWKKDGATTSHDAFLADRAIGCMKTFAPDVMTVAFGEIDCAHYGSWSRYVEAIRRTDELTWKLWKASQEIEAYKDQTLMLILPDHGRELDSPDGPGFVHHSDFYTNKGADEGCRRVWMLALGPTVKKGRQIETPVPITTAAATGLEYLGLQASGGAEKSVLNRIT